ncbi:MAG TPA: hypothetical protein VMH85_00250 [Terriglobales bacterium]|nr:hypothetical protein [Terriglobales bacterium]
MDGLSRLRAQQLGDFSAEDLELLIAKYTLEYLWRWTNGFDSAMLARIKALLEKAETPQDIASAFRRVSGSLPN